MPFPGTFASLEKWEREIVGARELGKVPPASYRLRRGAGHVGNPPACCKDQLKPLAAGRPQHDVNRDSGSAAEKSESEETMCEGCG